MYELIGGDCREVLASRPEASLDAIVCDPPYELNFMGKGWDNAGVSYDPATWAAILRAAKPGAHLLAFGGTRTFHRIAVAIEDAGWEIRDTLSWLYGSGFPKSLDVSKAIDKRGGNAQMAAEIGAALKQAREVRGIEPTEADRLFCDGTTNYSWFEGRPTGQRAPTAATFERIVAAWPEMQRYADAVATIEREATGVSPYYSAGRKADNMSAGGEGGTGQRDRSITAPATDAAKEWDGWGTALKPAWEPIIMARKPFAGTVAGNVLKHGTGAINVDACKIGTEVITTHNTPGVDKFKTKYGGGLIPKKGNTQHIGRWPPNVAMDEQAGELRGPGGAASPDWEHGGGTPVYGSGIGKRQGRVYAQETGGASRFMYVAKASASERNLGLAGVERVTTTDGRGETLRANHHPTVKPLALMLWLVRMVTPPGGTVCDPFMGSGTTGVAATLAGVDFLGIEMNPDYLELARARIAHYAGQPRQAALALEGLG